MSTQEFYTITKEDVGRSHIKAFGQTWPVAHFIGVIFSADVGKRVYERGMILQVESNEQRDQRQGVTK